MLRECRIDYDNPEVLAVGRPDKVTVEGDWFSELAMVFRGRGLSLSVVEEQALAGRVRDRLGDAKRRNGYRAYIVDSDHTKDLGEHAIQEIIRLVPDSYVVAVSQWPNFGMIRRLFRGGVSDVVTQYFDRGRIEEEMKDIISPVQSTIFRT